ncbi:MAG: hypothetical protein RL180_689 [Pseudomonadota bacterium]
MAASWPEMFEPLWQHLPVSVGLYSEHALHELMAVVLLAGMVGLLVWRDYLIRQQQRQMTQALLAANTGIWSWSHRRNHFAFSPEFFERYGYKRKQLPRNESQWLNFIHPEDVPRYLEHRAKPVNTEQLTSDSQTFDIRLRFADGDGFLHWVRLHGQVTRWDDKGTPQAASGRIENIDQQVESERLLVQARTRLQERTQLLSALLNNIPDLIWFKDEKHRYVDCNQAYAEFLGIPRHPILGRTDQELQVEHANAADDQENTALLASNQAMLEERWVQPLNTDQHHLYEIRKIPVQHPRQTIRGVLGISRDITERHQLMNELQRFKRFADNSAQGFCMVRMDDQVVYMNSRMCTLLNCSAEEANGQLFTHFYPPDIQQRLQQEVIPQVIAHGHWEGELRACPLAGDEFPTWESFFLIRDEHGQPLYLGDVMSDISEQKRVAQQLAEAKELAEQANQTKSTFLANMSHEIRTPLNAILGYAQLLSTDRQLTGRTHDRVVAIMNAGERLLGLINDILDIAKIEAGRLALNYQISSLHYEIKNICQLMQERIEAKGLTFDIRNDILADELVRVDTLKLGQILINLLGNATKFTEHGCITLHAYRQKNDVHISISDTGAGISPEDQAVLFTPFTQGSHAAHRAGGTGLGLALSQRLAALMQGTLTLHSTVGVGTTLALCIPLSIETSSAAAHLTLGQCQRVRVRDALSVLVAEDDEYSRDVLQSLLEDMGVDVHTAADGEGALALTQQHHFDIVLSDIMMPVMNGVQLLQHLQQQPHTQHIPVVAVTASTLDHQREELVQMGFRRVIGKPYRLQEIHDCIQTFCQIDLEVLDDIDDASVASGAAEAVDTRPLDPIDYQTLMQQLADFAMFGDVSGLSEALNPVIKRLPTDLAKALGQALAQMDLGDIERLALQELAQVQPHGLDTSVTAQDPSSATP